MLLIVMLGQKRAGWVNTFATADSFPEHFNRTLYSPTNRARHQRDPIPLWCLTYSTAEQPKAVGGRKSRQFENVERRFVLRFKHAPFVKELYVYTTIRIGVSIFKL